MDKIISDSVLSHVFEIEAAYHIADYKSKLSDHIQILHTRTMKIALTQSLLGHILKLDRKISVKRIWIGLDRLLDNLSLVVTPIINNMAFVSFIVDVWKFR